MQQFFLSAQRLAVGQRVDLPEDISYQLIRVLRIRGGERVRLVDEVGCPFLAQLATKGKRVQAEVLKALDEVREPATAVRLFLARIKKERFEWALQKCTELGVTEIYPLTTAYTTAKAPHSEENQQQRYERILREAAEQSERHTVPQLMPTVRFEELSAHLAEVNLLAYERSEASSPALASRLSELHRTGDRPRSVSLLIGPEGGFSDEEAEAAVAMGFLPISLGARILRAETAAMLGVGMIAQLLG